MPSHVRALRATGRPERPRKTVQGIMEQLDAWVARYGSGRYERDAQPMDEWMLSEDAGIQQDRREIEEFVSVLLGRGRLGVALEVGLGFFGSTHFLWRLLFDKVITIEKSHERLRTFGANLRAFYDRWVLDDHRSSFLIGLSSDPATVSKAYACAPGGGVDLLFIDGDHQYASVLTDWLLYSPLVKRGGIVAFHDAAVTVEGAYGVPAFLEQLSRGEIDAQPRTLQKIIRTQHMGIAFYENA